ELLHSLGGHIGVGQQRPGRINRLADRHQILHRIVRHALTHERWPRHQPAERADHERVSVRSRLDDQMVPYATTSAAAVVDDELLAQRFAELLRDLTGSEIRGAARRIGNDEANGTYRVLGSGRLRSSSGHREKRPHESYARVGANPRREVMPPRARLYRTV